MPEGFLARVRRVDRITRAAARRYGSSRLSLLARLYGHYRRRGIRPVEAIEAGLGDPALGEKELAGCFGKQQLVALQDRLNPRDLIGLTEDKAFFYPYCEAVGIPVPALFAVIGRGGSWRRGGVPLEGASACARYLAEAAPDAFVVKPAAGVYGEGVAVFRRGPDGFIDHAGRSVSAEELCQARFDDPKYDRFVVQERLTNHQAIVELTGCSYLQTVRIATLVDPKGAPHVLYAEWKLIGGDSHTDNFSYGRSGNFTANLDHETGALGPAMTLAADGVGSRTVPEHPKTGARLVGFRMPGWPELLDLVRRCALLFLPLRTVGWDIGLTPRGPVVVEGNRWWDPPTSSIAGPPAPGVALHPLSASAALLWR
jgi:hypothetical protein